jgi:hypothetical protein
MSATSTTTVAKARLRNFGGGTLEITDDGIRFYVETGRFRKQRQISREIRFGDIESVERLGNDLQISWKDNTDMFALEKTSQIEPIHERITAALNNLKKDEENKETVIQELTEFAQTTIYATETADSLFEILKKLHGRVDWQLVESSLTQSEENVGKLSSQGANSLYLDAKPLSTAVHQHRPEETSGKIYDVLRELYEHFDGLASSVDDAEKFHPNRRDAKLAIQAIYVLNDMALGLIVGDDAIGKKGTELFKVLKELTKLPSSRIDINAIKASLDNLCAEKDKRKSVVEEIKSTLEQRLKELLVSTAENPPETVEHQP